MIHDKPVEMHVPMVWYVAESYGVRDDPYVPYDLNGVTLSPLTCGMPR
jgi:hypothetical protein